MKTIARLAAASLLACAAAPIGAAQHVTNDTGVYIGEITAFAGNFCPQHWAPADGGTLPIARPNTPLFSLYGQRFGGDGRTTFGLPDMRGRAIIGAGAARWANRDVGDYVGKESHTLTVDEMRPHYHEFRASSAAPGTRSVAGAALATYPSNQSAYSSSAGPLTVQMSDQMVRPFGEGRAISLRQPYLVLTYCVAVGGAFPGRPSEDAE